MPSLHVPNLPEDVHLSLERLACSEQVSIEDFACRILTETVRRPSALSPSSVQALVQRLYGGTLPKDVVQEFLAQRRNGEPTR